MREPNLRGGAENHSPGGCRNTIHGDVAGTRGFALCMPKAKKVKKARHARHTGSRRNLRQRDPNGGVVTYPLTFRIKVKVRARAPRDVSEYVLFDNFTYTYYVVTGSDETEQT